MADMDAAPSPVEQPPRECVPQRMGDCPDAPTLTWPVMSSGPSSVCLNMVSCHLTGTISASDGGRWRGRTGEANLLRGRTNLLHTIGPLAGARGPRGSSYAGALLWQQGTGWFLRRRRWSSEFPPRRGQHRARWWLLLGRGARRRSCRRIWVSDMVSGAIGNEECQSMRLVAVRTVQGRFHVCPDVRVCLSTVPARETRRFGAHGQQ